MLGLKYLFILTTLFSKAMSGCIWHYDQTETSYPMVINGCHQIVEQSGGAQNINFMWVL